MLLLDVELLSLLWLLLPHPFWYALQHSASN